jgi:serine/threonine-protein kinase
VNADRDLISSALPAYEVGDELGKGGFGVVVSGRHRQLDREVAIKQLPVALAADPAVRRRFTAEARVLASLDHPHVVPVFDFVEREGLCLLVMELLPGGTLHERVTAAGGFTAPHSVAVSLACASGLGAAHRRGILHRDVKPDNMLFAASGMLKITDFGIAKVVGGSETVMTRVGEVLGTPAYIAPEQVRGGGLSPATDVYALATMLYELLAGTLPFVNDGEDIALLFKHAYEAPIPLGESAPAVPDAVAAVVMRALATEPAERFETAESFGVALAQASALAWGPGWLSEQGVPVMGAGAITTAAENPSGASRGAPAGRVPTARVRDLPTAPSPVRAPAAEGGAAAEPVSSRPDRRRALIRAAVIVAIIVIVILAIFVLPKAFTLYKSSAFAGIGLMSAGRLRRAATPGAAGEPRGDGRHGRPRLLVVMRRAAAGLPVRSP